YSIAGNILTSSDLGSYTYGDTHPQAVTSANSVTYTYDDNGSLTGDGTWTHIWDSRNRISQSSDGNTTISYAYDETGRRYLKDDGTTLTLYVNRYYDKEGATEKLHIYAGNMKIAINKKTTCLPQKNP
ncbi:hypothetical protein JXA05_00715, partial [Candidatus Peregrinibacteria bacterium]|nr:hypothetical protein [Candidatus Peregrinibacteria bacterium]